MLGLMDTPAWYLEQAIAAQATLTDAGVEQICMLVDEARLLKLNTQVRSHVIGETMQWPDELCAIGSDGCGNYFAIDPSNPGGGVVVIDHEQEEVIPLAPTLDGFVEWLLANLSDEALSG